jgi:lipopolysaccharide export system protein LptA
MWDETGSTAADEIVLEQKTGDVTAKGNVASSRVPDKKAAQGGMLSGDEPVQARAPLMVATDNHRKVRYEGGALVWQGASRISAERVTIDRDQGRLEAAGNVVSQFPDAAQGGVGRKSNAFTVVRAPELVYSDKGKVAHYRGGVSMERPTMQVRSRELRAFFREEKSPQKTETKLDRMLAEGRVEVVDKALDRVRRGSAERGEYFLEEEKMALTGGDPVLEDSRRGTTRGAVLTWFARQDRLIVDNTGGGPAVTRSLKP